MWILQSCLFIFIFYGGMFHFAPGYYIGCLFLLNFGNSSVLCGMDITVFNSNVHVVPYSRHSFFKAARQCDMTVTISVTGTPVKSQLLYVLQDL